MVEPITANFRKADGFTILYQLMALERAGDTALKTADSGYSDDWLMWPRCDHY
jgi:hypothetical protein